MSKIAIVFNLTTLCGCSRNLQLAGEIGDNLPEAVWLSNRWIREEDGAPRQMIYFGEPPEDVKKNVFQTGLVRIFELIECETTTIARQALKGILNPHLHGTPVAAYIESANKIRYFRMDSRAGDNGSKCARLQAETFQFSESFILPDGESADIFIIPDGVDVPEAAPLSPGKEIENNETSDEN